MNFRRFVSKVKIKDSVDDPAFHVVLEIKIVFECWVEKEEFLAAVQDWVVDVIDYTVHVPLNLRHNLIIFLIQLNKPLFLKNEDTAIIRNNKHFLKLFIKLNSRHRTVMNFVPEIMLSKLFACVCQTLDVYCVI